MKEELSRSLVRRLFDYDSNTGIVVWRKRPDSDFNSPSESKRWNSRYAGKRAGALKRSSKTYQFRVIKVHKVPIKEHRIIWMIMSNDDLPSQIDHVNGDPLDNRWINLRDGSFINCMNRAMTSANTSGFTGVSYHQETRKWLAKTMLHGKTYYLGLFDSPEEADIAVRKRRRLMGFSERHGTKVLTE